MKTAGTHNFARHFRIPVVPESRSDATQCNTMLPDATKNKNAAQPTAGFTPSLKETVP
jgi:hypothetical protein